MRLLVSGSLCILLVLMLVNLSNSLDVTGGKSINQTSGGSEDGSQAPSPRDGPYLISSREPIGGYRDPSQYTSQPVKFPSPPSNDDNNRSSSNTSEDFLTTSSANVLFSMSGDVVGEGTHSKWLSLNDIMGLKAR